MIAALDPVRFLEAFGRWTEGVLERLRTSGLGGKIEGVVAIDGKALRGALNAGEQPRVIVGAWAAELGICCAMIKRSDPASRTSISERQLVAALDPDYLARLLGILLDA